MITPLDIQNKEFCKGVRGYREDEVDSFLDLVTVDMEKLIDENQKMKEQVKSMAVDLNRYKNSESAILETLEAAKALMNDISASSEKRAQILLKNAELDAEVITREAKESVERLREEAGTLQNRVNVFKTKFRTLLEIELEKFDTLSAELFGPFDEESMEELSRLTGPTPPVGGILAERTASVAGAVSAERSAAVPGAASSGRSAASVSTDRPTVIAGALSALGRSEELRDISGSALEKTITNLRTGDGV